MSKQAHTQAIILRESTTVTDTELTPIQPELPHLDDSIIKQAWANVMAAEQARTRPATPTPPKSVETEQDIEVDDSKFSDKTKALADTPLLSAIYNNRHRLRALAAQLVAEQTPHYGRVSYDKLFDYFIEQLWFPYFAREMKFSRDTDENYNKTVARWVEQLLDMFLFEEVQISYISHYQYYYYHDSLNKPRHTSDRSEVKNYLEGASSIRGNSKEKYYSSLWEYLYEVIIPRSPLFKAKGKSGKLYGNYGEGKCQQEVEFTDSKKNVDNFLKSAPVAFFREYYFQYAKQNPPNDRFVDINSEADIDKFIFWICNNFSHNYDAQATHSEAPVKTLGERGFSGLMPDFSKLESVSAEMKVLAMKNLFNVRVNKTLDKKSWKSKSEASRIDEEFWESFVLSKVTLDQDFLRDISVHRREQWHHHFISKRSIAAKYERMETNSDVEDLVSFIKYLFGLYKVAEIYEKSTDKEQQLYGKVYKEVVRLYGHQLEQSAVNLEARLKVPQFRPDNLSSAIYTVQSLMNRSILPAQMTELGEVESTIQLLTEANSEIGIALSPTADYDRRLAAAEASQHTDDTASTD